MEKFIYDKCGSRFAVFVFHNQINEIPLRHVRAITVAFLVDTFSNDEKLKFYGVSSCSVLDEYNEQRGIDIAIGRAMKKRRMWLRSKRLTADSISIAANMAAVGRIISSDHGDGIQDIEHPEIGFGSYISEAYELARTENKKLNRRHNEKQDMVAYIDRDVARCLINKETLRSLPHNGRRALFS